MGELIAGMIPNGATLIRLADPKFRDEREAKGLGYL